MSQRTGTANLPLHGGRVPEWLRQRMARLGRVIVEAIALRYGRDAVLERLAHPFWFQAFGAVMGMDWHSSGITTSVVGALKRGLGPVEAELGLRVCGGRGRHSRATPRELRAVGERTGLDGDALARTSRLVAKVDSACLQDGYQLYLHAFVVADDGRWVVVQQGLCDRRREARRYHWRSEGLRDFVDAPHAAIDGRERGRIVNLTDRRAAPSREAQLRLVTHPDDAFATYRRTLRPHGPAQATLPHLQLPAHHDVRPSDVHMRRIHAAFRAAAERAEDFPELLLTPGLGARTLRALALVAEVVHGAPHRFSDPARFSLAHGGKDGHPFPVPLKVYDETLHILKGAVHRAKLGEADRLAALERLDRESRRLEAIVEGGESLEALLARERRERHRWGGRSVFGPAAPPRATADAGQAGDGRAGGAKKPTAKRRPGGKTPSATTEASADQLALPHTRRRTAR